MGALESHFKLFLTETSEALVMLLRQCKRLSQGLGKFEFFVFIE